MICGPHQLCLLEDLADSTGRMICMLNCYHAAKECSIPVHSIDRIAAYVDR